MIGDSFFEFLLTFNLLNNSNLFFYFISQTPFSSLLWVFHMVLSSTFESNIISFSEKHIRALLPPCLLLRIHYITTVPNLQYIVSYYFQQNSNMGIFFLPKTNKYQRKVENNTEVSILYSNYIYLISSLCSSDLRTLLLNFSK